MSDKKPPLKAINGGDRDDDVIEFLSPKRIEFANTFWGKLQHSFYRNKLQHIFTSYILNRLRTRPNLWKHMLYDENRHYYGHDARNYKDKLIIQPVARYHVRGVEIYVAMGEKKGKPEYWKAVTLDMHYQKKISRAFTKLLRFENNKADTEHIEFCVSSVLNSKRQDGKE